MILSEMSTPIQRSVMYPETPSEGDVLPEEYPFSPPVFNVTSDEYSVTDGDSQVSENTKPSCQSRLLFKLRESHQLSLLSLLVLANVDGFARCHEGWQSQSYKACITWHMSPP
jgi:hypothetical protein